jgi:hypothetical protein
MPENATGVVHWQWLEAVPKAGDVDVWASGRRPSA